ncbi:MULTISPECIES: acyl-CoA dehydrogenase family protein [Dactylosporangium]|uniref:Long-chain-acyl-CoA dehydrogenase n=2 Tax=Dactylosporangium TaxID=35753 RepID=A0A9W6NSX9_9ACTN|nr:MULTISPECIES: acyl-CoA dehydrogenase family protein [Dactylosporangium]UAB98173.1 acyl-CoA dehydrogenase family protein [Dactylosporangium vinaceum]UWZ46423.1 acyl-CoA dehydrogenase family protein [Dactylosporangium matsuzakiense]GLL08099.1 long-chain-acyl-CoA dehydrogenase [Dactylosporangium matsuzakiense]
MEQHLYEAEHQAFRDLCREFLAREAVPHNDEWDKAGIVDREIWRKAGAAGLLGMDVDEEYGGGGQKDFRFNAVLVEEIVAAGASGLGFGLHNDVVAPYLTELTTEEQKKRWLPGFCSGDIVTAIAMSEPGAGSDLAGIRTTAVRDGDSWVLNGQKTFITNGEMADLVVVVAKTDNAKGAHGISLFGVETGTPGFTRGRRLEKVGLKANDTAELFFDDCRIPADHLIGQESAGFYHLMANLPRERLGIAVAAVASAEAVLAMTLEYVRTREAFGRPIGKFQHNRFLLAELDTEVTIARTFVNHCIAEQNEGRLSVADAAKAKWWTTELQNKVADRCVQLHGGYGFMLEYPVAKAWLNSRVQTIYGGTTEIMKEIIGRSLGL